ncbi:1-phosphofructokinase [Cetobacterium somerae]|uniref:1-phosphofructokinase n=1 Tax=Cetobacterium sp. NK01 TaxID=2993530 RepID=UPI00211649F1|nr:1-phosphofructokinase [Cetobacterium sp. NK01]MCQ8212357.1 1-phosphofructokinase [Cetobacterium sp. NK01]
MIYTLTLNPALDYFLSFDSFVEGNLNIPKETYKLPGGKGINVSKILKNFDTISTCLGFIGGFTGEFIKTTLTNEGLNTNFFYINEDTRINIKINNNGLESEIAGTSPTISNENLEELFNFLKNNLKENDILALSGSVPSSIKSSIYADIIDIIPKGVKVILDTRGLPFDIALKKGVFLIKPNKDEINEFFQANFSTNEELIEAGKKLQILGAQNVLISLGSKGSIFIADNDIFISGVPEGTLISSNGSGDSMIGGFIYGLNNNFSLKECYKIGIASGSATAFSKGLATFDTMKNLLKDIKILKL